MEKVAIVGMGQTRHEARKINDRFEDMVYEAVILALADAGMTMKQIDSVITTSNDFWDGRTISSMATGDVSGASMGKNVSCIEGDGTFGAFYGLTRILSGNYGTTLVTAYTKGSEGQSHLITNCAFDPILARGLGLDMITACALQARKYMERYGITEEQMAAISVKNHGNALNNPNAHLGMDISIDDVMASKKIADPLKLLDCSPISDGAACIILANEKIAKRVTDNPVWVKGVSFCADAYQLGDRDLSECKALEKAARKAYRMAGIKNPRKEIDLAEVYDAFTYQEALWTEGLGLCAPGKGGAFAESGKSAKDGVLPVNPSGGLMGAHPVLAAGMIRMIEAGRQIRQEAGPMQIGKKVKTAVAHGVNGLCGQSHCVWVLGRK